MVRKEKLNNALAALNAILVAARAMAYEGSSHDEMANALDAAEYLPRLLADLADQTDTFREALVGLASMNSRFGFALERFDNENLGRW